MRFIAPLFTTLALMSTAFAAPTGILPSPIPSNTQY